MPKSRQSQISLSDTPYYHCISRCVRRAYLCGEDSVTGNSYEHRRGWVENKLLALAQVFAIDVCAYAVMSNHTHVVLHVDRDEARAWTMPEVLHRWHTLHKGTLLTRQYMDEARRGEMSAVEIKTVEDIAQVYRERLYDISWFMRHLNEYIAREANREDGCTGRFWEGRFKSQALLDEAALAACMAYVDLNPVRAGIADTPEASTHTSIQHRAKAVAQKRSQPDTLKPFAGNSNNRDADSKSLPFRLTDYLNLVDMTVRVIREDKKGYINAKQSPILVRLNISAENWQTLTTEFEKRFTQAAGAERSLLQYKQHVGQKRVKGMGNAKRLLSVS